MMWFRRRSLVAKSLEEKLTENETSINCYRENELDLRPHKNKSGTTWKKFDGGILTSNGLII